MQPFQILTEINEIDQQINSLKLEIKTYDNNITLYDDKLKIENKLLTLTKYTNNLSYYYNNRLSKDEDIICSIRDKIDTLKYKKSILLGEYQALNNKIHSKVNNSKDTLTAPRSVKPSKRWDYR